jgi:hypothetical protein
LTFLIFDYTCFLLYQMNEVLGLFYFFKFFVRMKVMT